MNIRKVIPVGTIGKPSVPLSESRVYDTYVAVDWSMRTMAIAWMKADDQSPQVWQGSSSLRRLIEFVDGCKGRTILTFEETTGAHWLYGKLLGHVDRLIVCDPTQNRLLCAGPKNDRIDAAKLCLLLRQGNLKEVYHSTSELYNLRLLVSAADDIIRSCVAAKNRLKAQYRSHSEETSWGQLVIRQLEEEIALYSAQKKAIECEFQASVKHNSQLRHLTEVPGIGFRTAVHILGTVIDARRFPSTGHYLSYCGLVWHQKFSQTKWRANSTTVFNRRHCKNSSVQAQSVPAASRFLVWAWHGFLSRQTVVGGWLPLLPKAAPGPRSTPLLILALESTSSSLDSTLAPKTKKKGKRSKRASENKKRRRPSLTARPPEAQGRSWPVGYSCLKSSLFALDLLKKLTSEMDQVTGSRT